MADLQKNPLFSLEPLPLPPMAELQPSMQKYITDLHNYLRRLVGLLTGTNIVRVIEEQTEQTLLPTPDNTTDGDVIYFNVNQWVAKNTSTLKVFTGTPSMTFNSSKQLEITIPHGTVRVIGTMTSSGTTTLTYQAVSLAQVVRDVDYNTSNGALTQDHTASVYVFEKGNDTEDHSIDTAEECT